MEPGEAGRWTARLEQRIEELERQVALLRGIGPIGGKVPRIDPTAFVAFGAHVCGDVLVEAEASIWFGSVVRGDVRGVLIHRNVHVEDNSVLHSGTVLELGPYVVLGHNVVAHCRRIGAHCLIGNGAIILDEAEIGDHCIVAAGAVVASGTKVPPGSLVAGVPAVVKGQLDQRQLDLIDMYRRSYDRASQQYLKAGYGQALTGPEVGER